MKRKGVRLAAGAVLVVCLCGAYYGLKFYNETTEQAEEEAAEGETILEVDSDTLTGISFLIDGESVSFTKQEDDTWQLDGDDTFPVDSATLLSPVAQLEPLKSVRTLTDVEDTSEYGFEEPQNRITLTDEDGSQTILTIGDNNSSTGNDYLMLDEDDSEIYTISTGLRTSFADELYDYAVSEELPTLQTSQITGVRVTRADDSYELYLEDALWMVRESETQDGETADADLVNDSLSALSGLSYADYLEHNCTDGSAYGLDGDATVVTISYDEEVESETEDESATETESSVDENESERETETEVVTVTRTLAFLVGDTDENGDYYVQQEDSKEVHTIPASVLSQFLSGKMADWIETEEETETETGTEAETETEMAAETEA